MCYTQSFSIRHALIRINPPNSSIIDAFMNLLIFNDLSYKDRKMNICYYFEKFHASFMHYESVKEKHGYNAIQF